MLAGTQSQRLIRPASVDLGIGYVDVDFVNDLYYVNTLPVTKEDIFDLSTPSNYSFDAFGWYHNDGTYWRSLNFKGDALAAIVGHDEFTCFAQYRYWTGEPVYVEQTGSGHYFIPFDYGTDVQDAYEIGGGDQRWSRTFETTYPDIGPHAFAVTRTPSRIASSVNGSAVAETTDTVSALWTDMNAAALGGQPGVGGSVNTFPESWLQRFVWMPPQSDAVLQTLSVPETL